MTLHRIAVLAGAPPQEALFTHVRISSPELVALSTDSPWRSSRTSRSVTDRPCWICTARSLTRSWPRIVPVSTVIAAAAVSRAMNIPTSSSAKADPPLIVAQPRKRIVQPPPASQHPASGGLAAALEHSTNSSPTK